MKLKNVFDEKEGILFLQVRRGRLKEKHFFYRENWRIFNKKVQPSHCFGFAKNLVWLVYLSIFWRGELTKFRMARGRLTPWNFTFSHKNSVPLESELFRRPLNIFLTLYFVIVCSTKIKKKKHVQVQSWELPRIWTLQCRRFNHRSGVRVSKMIKCTINLSQNEQRLFSWMLYYSIVVVSLTNGFFPRSV